MNVKAGVSCGYRCALKGYKGGEHLSCCATEQTIRSCGAAIMLLASSGHVNTRFSFPFRSNFCPIENTLLTKSIRAQMNPRGLYNRKKKKNQRVPALATNTKVHNFNFLHKPEKTSLRMWKL
jgi:hypothetical protein